MPSCPRPAYQLDAPAHYARWRAHGGPHLARWPSRAMLPPRNARARHRAGAHGGVGASESGRAPLACLHQNCLLWYKSYTMDYRPVEPLKGRGGTLPSPASR